MAGNYNQPENLQNQQELQRQKQQRAENAQSAEFSSSMPDTDEADIQFTPDQQLEDDVQKSS